MSTTHRSDGPLLPGYHHSGDRGLGVLAQQVPGTGQNGPAIPFPSLQFPADNGKEIMITILTVPPLLTLFTVDEYGVVSAEGPPGVHQGLWQGRADGVLFTPVDQAPFYILIGSSGMVSGSLVAGDAVASGLLDAAGLSILGGGVTADNAVASGAVQGYVEPVAIIGKRVVVAGSRRTPTQLVGLDVAEIDDIAFRFGSQLRQGEVVNTYDFTAEPRVGVDATPLPLKVGEPQKFGPDCIQRVSGAIGVAGVTYLLRCVATLNSGRVVVASAFMRVVRSA